MTRILACIILSLSLGGCLLTTAAQPIGQTSVDLQKGAYEAKLAYQGSLILAVAYIERPRCGHPASPILCSQQSIVDTMRQAIIATDAATQAAENAARTTGPDTTIASALVIAATQAAAGFKTAAAALK